VFGSTLPLVGWQFEVRVNLSLEAAEERLGRGPGVGTALGVQGVGGDPGAEGPLCGG